MCLTVYRQFKINFNEYNVGLLQLVSNYGVEYRYRYGYWACVLRNIILDSWKNLSNFFMMILFCFFICYSN